MSYRSHLRVNRSCQTQRLKSLSPITHPWSAAVKMTLFLFQSAAIWRPVFVTFYNRWRTVILGMKSVIPEVCSESRLFVKQAVISASPPTTQNQVRIFTEDLRRKQPSITFELRPQPVGNDGLERVAGYHTQSLTKPPRVRLMAPS